MSVSLSIKNVPNELAEALRARAREHHRSLQGELLAVLEESVRPRGRLTVEEVYQRAVASGLRTADDSVEIIREMRNSRYGS